MLWSSAEVIEVVTPSLPKECLDDNTISNIRALAERLPDIFSSFYLECRLSAAQDQVDFLASLAPPSGADLARLRASAERPPDEFRSDPAWRFVWDALRRWVGPDHWHRRLPFMWLEFDHVNMDAATRRPPSLWVCVDRGYSAAGQSSSHQESLDQCLNFLTPVVSPTLAASLSAGGRRSMSACFRHLPPGGRIIHLSLMFARDPVTIKLYGAVPKSRLGDYLRDVGWPGPIDVLQQIVRSFYTPETADDTVYFDLSLGDELLPCAGIAFSQLQRHRSADARRALLGLLDEHGLCDPQKRAPIAAWSGLSRERHPEGSSSALVRRWLDTKIVLHSDQSVSAKGYLGFAPALSVF